jgi:ATP-dependent Lhr-like helicase
VEYAARYRDAFGIPLPPGLAEAFLRPSEGPLGEIARRYARTHGPFTVFDVANRYGLEVAALETVLRALHSQGKLLEGEFLPKGSHREWCDPETLQQIRRKSLANLRREIEPVEQKTLSRLLTRWQGVHVPRKGLDALLDAIELLQGTALLASDLEREILPARVAGFEPNDLDALMAAGEVVWTGVEQVGDRDGRIALYLTEALPLLVPPAAVPDREPLSERAAQIAAFLEQNGASFFPEISAACGGGFPGEILDALWELVWRGEITNDTFHTVRRRLYPPDRKNERKDGPSGSPEFLRRLRTRKSGDGIRGGRWSLLRTRKSTVISPTEWSANTAQQLLTRYGIVTRETAIAENIPGGYNSIYPALRTMEESGLIRRGMFVAGLGAAQFAMPSAVDMLRSLRNEPTEPESTVLAASDPANPYGSLLPWAQTAEEEKSAPHAMARVSGASVVLVNGQLAAFLRRKNPAIKVFLPEAEPERSHFAAKLARQLAELAVKRQQGRRSGLLIAKVNEIPARQHPLAPFLEDAGFSDSAGGYYMRRVAAIAKPIDEDDEIAEDASETA